MSKINRYNGNLQAFGINSTGNYRTIFGDESQSDALDDNVNSDYLSGWEIIGITEEPTKQDFNALGFTQGQLLAYIHQMGIPEYNSSQEYYSDSICTYDGVIYISITDGNTGNTPSASPSNWTEIMTTTSMSALYYTKAQLDAGQLDNRYYTEIELDAGQLDNRYYTETELDAGQLDNRYYTETEITSLLSGYILSTEKGAVNGVCPLDGSGLVDSSYLPSYVDDILEYATYSALPATGETGKIYIITTDGDGHVDEVYRWSGSVYVQIGSNILQADDSLKLGGQLPAYYSAVADIDDTPVNGEISAPISSNWAYDHVAAADPHAGYMLESNIGTDANNYLQLNGSSQIPAVSGALLTNVNADLLDGVEGANYLRSDTDDYTTGNLGIGTSGNPGTRLDVRDVGASATEDIQLANFIADYGSGTTNDSFGGHISFTHRTGGNFLQEHANIGIIGRTNNSASLHFRASNGTGNPPVDQLIISQGQIDCNNNKIINIDWANSDDGAGSYLDADTVDGIQGADIAQTTISTQTFTGQNTFNKLDSYNLAQGDHSAKTSTGTLGLGDVEARIITVNISSGGTLTLDTAANFDSYFSSVANNYALLDISIINISTTAADDVTIAAGTGWTMIGNMVIEANDSDRANSSARLRLRKTGTAAWSCYRLS